MRTTLVTLILGAAGLSPGCFSPPVLQWYDQFPPDIEAAGYVEPYDVVELEVAPGTYLRGVHLPAGEGAPLVLHLLGSGSSVVGTYHRHEGVLRAPAVAASLRAAGYASLIVDYRGVGASDGERDPEHLAADVALMYAAAVALAGTEQRVFVRSISIGTLPAGQLLAAGHSPAAVVLVAPVRNETVASHYAYENYPALLAFIGLLSYSLPIELDTNAALARADVPLLVLCPEVDLFLPGEERDELRAQLEGAGATWVTHGATHPELSLEARDLLPGELEFLHDVCASR